MEDRLLKLLDTEQLSSAKFADLIGVQRSSVSHILSGRNKPSFDFLQKTLKAFPMINADWLILGEGNMYEGEINTVSGSLFDKGAVDELENVKGRSNTAAQTGSVENGHSDVTPDGDDISGKIEADSEIPYPKTGTDEKIGQAERMGNVPSDGDFSHLNEEHDKTNKSANKRSKTISRVIVFYTDKSFESYEKAD